MRKTITRCNFRILILGSVVIHGAFGSGGSLFTSEENLLKCPNSMASRFLAVVQAHKRDIAAPIQPLVGSSHYFYISEDHKRIEHREMCSVGPNPLRTTSFTDFIKLRNFLKENAKNEFAYKLGLLRIYKTLATHGQCSNKDGISDLLKTYPDNAISTSRLRPNMRVSLTGLERNKLNNATGTIKRKSREPERHNRWVIKLDKEFRDETSRHGHVTLEGKNLVPLLTLLPLQEEVRKLLPPNVNQKSYRIYSQICQGQKPLFGSSNAEIKTASRYGEPQVRIISGEFKGNDARVVKWLPKRKQWGVKILTRGNLFGRNLLGRQVCCSASSMVLVTLDIVDSDTGSSEDNSAPRIL